MRRRRAVDPRTGRLYRIIRPARLASPPTAVRRARLDNLALVPASLLPYKEQWQQLVDQLPDGTTLIVLPVAESPQRTTLQMVARGLRAKGQSVTTVQADEVARLIHHGPP